MVYTQKSGPGAATFKLHGNQLWEENIVEHHYHKYNMMDLVFIWFGAGALLETVVNSAYQSLIESRRISSLPMLVANRL